MPGLQAVRQALADTLNGVGPPGRGIRAAADQLITVNPPAAMITLQPGTAFQAQTINGSGPQSGQYIMRVTVLVGIGDNRHADELLSAYLSTSGPGSLLAAIAANPTLNRTVDWAVVQAIVGYGWVEWGGVNYLGAHLIVQVGVSG